MGYVVRRFYDKFFRPRLTEEDVAKMNPEEKKAVINDCLDRINGHLKVITFGYKFILGIQIFMIAYIIGCVIHVIFTEVIL